MEFILAIAISVLAFFSFVNFLILVYLAAFLVRLRGFVDDVLSAIIGEEEDEDDTEELPVPANLDVKPKTWDQKYEEELDLIQRQIRKERGQSGLMDLE
jgi:hypothetical protein